jgi:hypothetical protein
MKRRGFLFSMLGAAGIMGFTRRPNTESIPGDNYVPIHPTDSEAAYMVLWERHKETLRVDLEKIVTDYILVPNTEGNRIELKQKLESHLNNWGFLQLKQDGTPYLQGVYKYKVNIVPLDDMPDYPIDYKHGIEVQIYIQPCGFAHYQHWVVQVSG